MLKYKFYCKKKINNKDRNIYKLEKSKKEFIKYKGSFIHLKKYLKLKLKLKSKSKNNNKKYGGNQDIISSLSPECRHVFSNPEKFDTSLDTLTDLNTEAVGIYEQRLTGGKKKIIKKKFKKGGENINYSKQYLDFIK